MFNQAVAHSAEIDRILALPRRTIESFGHTQELTELLKTPSGTMELRQMQALALHDMALCGGCMCLAGVGEGKTLVSLLATHVLGAKKPMLMQPAGLIKKTEIDWLKLNPHWLIPKHIRLFSYEMLGRVDYARELEIYQPDLFIFDECHKLKNPHAAVTRRIARYLHDHPETMVVALSGTIMRRSLHDFAHILRWCLKDRAPIPKPEHELNDWAAALDDDTKVEPPDRYEPGALLSFAPGGVTTEDARRGFQKRLVETPGVVSTVGNGERVDCSLYIRAIQYELSDVTIKHFAKLRSAYLTPDDWKLMEAVEVWRHARELALGFHQIWDPRPPDEWRAARRAWNSFVRTILTRSHTLDSPLDVANACDAGRLPNEVLETWRRVDRESGFIPNAVPVWHDDSALKVAAKWMKKPGIVWAHHIPFALRLSEMTGCKYYGAEGLAADGELIDRADPRKAVIASVKANKEGRNLQTLWNRNLLVSPSDGADEWQQLIGRTHRPGQLADEVEVDVFLGCVEHVNAFRRARASARAIRDTTGADAKLLIADVSWPTDVDLLALTDARWLAPPPDRFEIPV